MEDFMELPPKTPLNSGDTFCGMELKHTKCVFGLSRHFAAMSTVALLVAIVGVISLLPNAAPSNGVSFIPVCRLVFVK
jgi:hypothetical protein